MNYRLVANRKFLKLDANAELELVWTIVEGPLLFEAPGPVSGRGKVDKIPRS